MKDPRDQETFELFGFNEEEEKEFLNRKKKPKSKRANSKCEI